MRNEQDIKNAESTSHYQFPFLDGALKKTILNPDIKKEEFLTFDFPTETGEYKYTQQDIEDLWQMVCVQRIVFEAALSVFRKEFIAINPALEHYGYYKIVG